MIPRIATIGHISIYSYGACIALAIITFVYCIHRDERAGNLFSHTDIDTVICTGIIASLIGGKLYTAAVIMLSHSYTLSDIPYITWYSGLSISGSVISAIGACSYMIYRYRMPYLATCDVLTQYAPLLHAFGRIGCFFAGCCYGQTTTSCMHVIYTHPESWAPLSIPVHPVQLYAAAGHIVLLALLWYLHTSGSTDGVVTGSYLIGFAAIRGILDMMRHDFHPAICGISHAQIITIAITLLGIAIFIYTGRYGKHA